MKLLPYCKLSMFSDTFYILPEQENHIYVFVQEIWGGSRILITTKLYTFFSVLYLFLPQTFPGLLVSCNGLKIPFLK